MDRKKEELSKQLEELQIHKELETKLEKQSKRYKELENKLKGQKDLLTQLEKEKSELHKELMTYKKVAYLTFDDGPSENTIKILDILKEQQIKATFFVNGRTDQISLDTYKRIVDEGHMIGNHTFTHDYQALYQSADGFIQDFNHLNHLLKEKLNIQTKFYRFPGGSNNSISHKYGGKGVTTEIASKLKKQGYVYFDWNVDSMDSKARVVSKSEIVNSVLNGSKNQQHAIILMHDLQGKQTTVEALPEIINGLKEQGFAFEGFSEYSYNKQFIDEGENVALGNDKKAIDAFSNTSLEGRRE
jgi:peptidoglycan-N-acetylglucosamine deacetylase